MQSRHETNALFVLFVVALAAPLASSYAVDGSNIREVRVSGRYVCSNTGSPMPGSRSKGLAGVPVGLVCSGSEAARTVTNATGYYEASVDTTGDIDFDPSSCSMLVQLPVHDCDLLPKNGTLQSPLSLIEVVQTAIGDIASFIAAFVGICFNGNCTHY